jgi:outer membrane autotransporter protein
MTKKPSLLKTMLATASTVAVLLGSVEAGAAVSATTTAAADTTTGTGAGGSPITDGSDITFGGAHTLTIDSKVLGLILDADGNAATVAVTAGGDGTTFGLMTGPFTALNFTGAATATLTDSTDFTITNTTFASAAAELVIEADNLNLTGAIDGTGAGLGVLTVTGANVTITGATGNANTLDKVSVANTTGTTTFTGVVKTATSITIDGTGAAKFNAAITPTLLKFTANGTATLDVSSAVTTTTFAAEDAKLIIASAQTLTGAVTASTTDYGIIEATPNNGATTTITGNVAASGTVVKQVVNTGQGKLNLNGNVYATNITFDNAAGNDIQIKGTVEADVTTTNAGKGRLLVNTTDVTFDGQAGTETMPIDAVRFETDNKFTFATDAKVYGSFTTLAQNQGEIEIDDDTTFYAIGDEDYNVKLLTVNTASKTATLTDDVYLNQINFAADGTVKVSDGANVYVGPSGVTTTTNSKGSLVFDGASVVEGKLGTPPAGNALKSVTFSGNSKTVELAIQAANDGINADTIAFDGDTTLRLSIASAANIDAATAITVATKNTGKISAADNLTITSPVIAATATPLKEIHLETASKTLTFDDAGVIYVNDITTATNNEGTVVFSGGAHTISGNVGADDAAFEVVTAGTGNDTFGSNVYAETFTVTGANTITVAGILSGTTFNFGAHAATLALGDGATVDMLVKNTAAANTTVSFAGGGTISKDLGETGTVLDTITFAGTSGDDIINVGADMYATNITTGANIVNVTTDVTVGAAATTLDLSDTTLKLNKNTLTLKTLAAAPIFNADSVVDIAVTGSDNGKIDNSTNTTQAYNFSNAVLNISSASGVKNGVSFVVYEGGVAPAATFAEVTADGRFFKYASAKNDDDFTIQVTPTQLLKFEDDIRSVANVTAQDLQVAKDLGDAAAGATGNAELEIGAIYDSANSTEAAQIIKKIAPNASTTSAVTATATHVAMDVTTHASNEVASRVVSLNTGAAAGEAGSALGAWAKGFFAKATEKAKGNASGYKADINGGTLGFDMNANDATVVGFAVSLANTNAKFKNAKAGDKLEGKSMLFNVYGMYDCGDDKFVQAGINFGNTNVKARTKRNFGTAIGKFDVMNYGVNLMGGMNYKAAESFVITPMAGLTYGKFLSGGYTETGAGASNQTHAKKNFDKLVGTLGLRFTSQIDAGGDMKITPEAHGFVNHDFRNKGLKDTFTIDGLGRDITVKGTKQSATSYNVGLSLTAKSGNMEYGVGYDADLKTKYVSHQGSVKVRVNF